jgi:flagellar protein FlaG
MLLPSSATTTTSASPSSAAAAPAAAATLTADASKPKPAPASEFVSKPTHSSTPDLQAVKKAVAALNQSLEQGPTSVRFQLNENSGKTVVTLVDTEKNSVLLQFPNDSVLTLSGILPLTQGSIINTKA